MRRGNVVAVLSEVISTYVYLLIDGDLNEPFYVGITSNPKARLSAHCSDPISAAYERIQACDSQVTMRIEAEFRHRRDALDYESMLIRRMPGLLNRTSEDVEWASDRKCVPTDEDGNETPRAAEVLPLKSGLPAWMNAKDRKRKP